MRQLISRRRVVAHGRALARVAALLMSGCAQQEQSTPASATTEQPPAAEPVMASPTAISLDTVATNLEVPWALDFTPDGRVFVTERPGRIRVIEAGVLQPEPWAELPVFAHDAQLQPESGLMGVAVARDFAATGHVYVVGTFWKSSGGSLPGFFDRAVRRLAGIFSAAAAIPYENRVYRLTDRGGRGVDAQLIVDGLPANYYHAGGALSFGPDGMLYLTTGEALMSSRSQDRNQLSGKILRYTPVGGIPGNNPIPGSPVYAIGLRNSQGIAWHPSLDLMVGIEHGPSFLPSEGGRHGRDELNVVTPGVNFGWPVTAGNANDPRFSDPIAEWSPAIAPGGVTFYTGVHRPWHENAFVSGLRGQQLRRLVFDSAAVAGGQLKVVQEEVMLAGLIGRVRAVRMGPDGLLWITTSNRDGRGQPSARADMVLRVRPKSQAIQPD